ncbi:MAG: class I SAM-dependent methyltransferase [Chloroflexota bacterium]
MGSASVQGELWSENASDWSDYQEVFNTPLFEAMLGAAIVRSGTKFLDVGCGAGTSSAAAARRGAIVTGLDAAPSMIEVAARRLPSGDFRVGDMENLPFEDESFDVVFAANSIQFAADVTTALAEMKRVCRKRGYIVTGLFGSPDRVDIAIGLKAAVSVLPDPPQGDGPFALSINNRLTDLFESAQLEVVTLQHVYCPYAYPDFDTYWLAMCSSGPVVHMMRQVGKDKIKEAVHKAAIPFINQDGEVRFEQNQFQYIVAKKI